MKRLAILLAFSAATLVPAAAAFAGDQPPDIKVNTPTPPPDPNAPKTIACPHAGFTTKVDGKQLWDTRVILAAGAKATNRHRKPGTGSDVMWCGYEQISPSVAGVSSKVFVVKQAPSTHPICTGDSGAMSFTCRALKPGESY